MTPRECDEAPIVKVKVRKPLLGVARSGTLAYVENSQYFDEGSNSGFRPEEVVLEELIDGHLYSVRVPRGWTAVSDPSLVELVRASSRLASVDVMCADTAAGGGFAPSCVVACQPVEEGCEGEWFELSTRALLEDIPGFVVLDMGVAVDAPEGNVLLLGTYILEGESLTCMQCLWVDQAPNGYGSGLVGVSQTLTCATKDFPSLGEVFTLMVGSCERLWEGNV